MKHYVLALIFLASFSEAAISRVHAVHVISPLQNQEICASTSVPLSAAFKNSDISSHTLLARFTISNIVTGTVIDSASDTLYNVPPGAVIDTSFPSYVMNPNILSQLGTFFACATVTAFDSVDHPIKDWAFADTSCVRIFGIRTTPIPYIDPSDNYSRSVNGDFPDQLKWVSIGAKVVDGENETWDPPPPRYTKNDGGVGPDQLFDAVIRMDRSDANGLPYAGSGVGDTLASFPVNLIVQTKFVLTFDFMRGGKHLYPDLWDADTMAGPEQTVLNSKGDVIRPGDSLIIEFKDPAESSCNPVKWNRITAIDGGHDFQFQSFWMLITDTSATFHSTGQQSTTISLDRNYMDSNFRFRLRLAANNNAIGSSPVDDNDQWYVDNLFFEVPRKATTQMSWVRVVTPYTKIPFSEASALPVYFSVKNNSVDLAVPFPVDVWITNSDGDTVYFQTMSVNSLPEGTDSVIRMPDWNAQNAINTSSFFTVNATITNQGFDNYTQAHTTYSNFFLNAENGISAIQEFAYDDAGMDPQRGAGNDIPFIDKITGAGIGFQNGSGSYAMKFVLSHSDTVFGARIYFAAGNSAPDAIRISLLQGDPNSCIPRDPVLPMSRSVFEDVRKGGIFDNFTAYFFTAPIIVSAGTYWLSVSQLALGSMMVGGDVSRGGGSTTVADSSAPEISPLYADPYGTQWSPTQNNGDVSCAFAVETGAGSGNWTQWIPSQGWWPTNALGNGQQAIGPSPQLSAPYVLGGSYLPMIRVMVGGTSILSEVMHEHAGGFGFEEMYPNPFAPSSGTAQLNFTLSEDGFISLIIYDEMGTEIRKIAANKMEKGRHTEHWDGKDANGNRVTPGVYFCRLTEGGRTASGKIAVVE